jgi:predicted Zn-dependent protease
MMMAICSRACQVEAGRYGADSSTLIGLDRYAAEAARQAVVQLEAREAPAGSMEVVLGPGWPGILLQ